MRFSTLGAALLINVVLVVTAASSSSSTTSTSSTTAPLCGLLCIQTETIKSTCSLTNTTCICTNDALKASIQTCVNANCTINEALQTEKYSYTKCGAVPEDRAAMVWHLGIAFMILGMVAFGLRLLERIRASTWGLDDLVVGLVTLILIPMGALTVPLSQKGLGMDMWNVGHDNINQVLYYFYWEEVLYAVALGLNKVSILVFYLRVFPQELFRVAVYIMIALNLGYSIAYSLAVVFQCSPIDGAWKSWDGEYDARCVNINTLGWSGAAVNIAFDLGTLILPLPVLYHLTMSLRRKIQIMLMFAVGFFVTLVSILRLRSIVEFGNTVNVTQDYVEVGYWSTIEISVGILCACMPAIRALLSRIFPRLLGGSRHGTTTTTSPAYEKSGISKSGSGGVPSRLSGRPKRFSLYGGTQAHGGHEWEIAGNTNSSAVELVNLEKMRHESSPSHVAAPAKMPDQWSVESGGMELPIQGAKGSY